MSESENKELLRRWFAEVWNQGDESAIDRMFAKGGVGYGLGDTETDVHGPEQMKTFVRTLRNGLQGIHMAIDDMVAEGDRVSARITVTGTHAGSDLGVAPTGKPVKFAAIVLVRIHNGQIVEGWNSWDQLGMLRQIGALPGADETDRFLGAGPKAVG